jgi:opacity protein-like surface antigen
MKRFGLLCGVMLLFAGLASAQDEAPKIEAFAGYSYLRVNPGFGNPGENYNGGSGSLAYNFTSNLGLVGDFGGYHWSQTGVDGTAVSYLFGPKFAIRKGPITPFVQALFGGAHVSFSSCDSGCGSESQNAFAMALGGGLDWNATAHLGIRLIQAEYVLTRFGVEHSSDTQNDARISTGVVFRW